MSDETTLLPCPFCGGEARLVNDYSSEKGMSYQIWHECTGHEGRGGGYGQGVKPFFDTPWYATDAEAIEAWNTRAYLNPDGLPAGLTISDDGDLLNWRGDNYVRQGSGTLTAEHVKRIHEIIEKHWHDLSDEYDMPEATALPEYSYNWQAIADDLSAELGSGTCEVECFDDGVDEGLDGEWFSYAPPTWYLSCGHTAQGTERPTFCPSCGCRIKEQINDQTH